MGLIPFTRTKASFVRKLYSFWPTSAHRGHISQLAQRLHMWSSCGTFLLALPQSAAQVAALCTASDHLSSSCYMRRNLISSLSMAVSQTWLFLLLVSSRTCSTISFEDSGFLQMSEKTVSTGGLALCLAKIAMERNYQGLMTHLQQETGDN